MKLRAQVNEKTIGLVHLNSEKKPVIFNAPSKLIPEKIVNIQI
jgi:hypothetical protein